MQLESYEYPCTPAMIGAVQTFGGLTNWHPHIHSIVAEGVFDKDGNFVPVEDIRLERAVEIWRDKVFDLLFDAGLLRLDTIDSMRTWRYSGFNIDTSVRIAAEDHAGMQRLVEYIARCPFSLARMVKLTDDGKVMYHGNHPNCHRYPKLGEEMSLQSGMRRNYQLFEPLDFLASVTQHIPDKGEHQIRYYGWYSNKSRGMRKEKTDKTKEGDKPQPLNGFQLKCRITWAALIKAVYEVDPLECPQCGAAMKITGFVERDQSLLLERYLKAAGLWKEPTSRAPPAESPVLIAAACTDPSCSEPSVDYEYFAENCA
jgi:hypothetical protein